MRTALTPRRRAKKTKAPHLRVPPSRPKRQFRTAGPDWPVGGLGTRKEGGAGHHDSAEALRACEVAAARVKCASDELAARWVELAREISDGAGPTELLRTRAWCNVLELRLKERASALEEARQLLDGAWPDIMTHPAAVMPTTERRDPDIPCEPTDAHWPFLAQATNGFAAAACLPKCKM